MIQTLRELLRFYSHKYHVPIQLFTDSKDVERWDRTCVLVAMPPDTGQEKILSDLVVCQDPKFARYLGGDPIVLDDDMVARAGQKFLTLCFHPVNDKSWTFATKLVEQHLPKIVRSFRHQQRDDLIESVTACVTDRRKELQASMREDGYELERLSLQVMQLSRKLENDRQMYRIFERPTDWIKKRASRTYADLTKLVPGIYESLRFEDEAVIGVTHKISLYYDGSNYDFDPYEVEVNLRQGKVRIRGGTDCNGYIHPHVTDDSNICWGNIGPLVSRLAGEVDLFPLFQLIHQFLTSYNASDPFQKIEKWDPDWEEPEDEDEPYCSFCDAYGHTIGDCDSCWWCDHCNEYVDHDEEDCPNRPKPESEEIHEPELAEA
jgi:hypothetical protein